MIMLLPRSATRLKDRYCVLGRCGAAEGCLYPSNLADADGKFGVSFRTCAFKAQPITVSGTTALPPETTRTGDMAAWTSGAGPPTPHSLQCMHSIRTVSIS